MKDSVGTSRARQGQEPKLQIICLASGGGPNEDNVTGFLVRCISTKWAKNSVLAVDAGSHLAPITRILQEHFPLVSGVPEPGSLTRPRLVRNGSIATDDGSINGEESSSQSSAESPMTILDSGAFAGLPFPYESARANALHVVRECISTYLITHAHLDHLAGFVINTAAFHNTSRPKRLAAMPSTVNAIKTHIFNDIIWPNLTDEDGGVGFVTFQRLAQGGNIQVGEGSGKGYIEVCDGICVKGMKLSHGHCTRGPQSQMAYHRDSEVGLSEAMVLKLPGHGGHTSVDSPRINSTRRTPSISQISQPGTPGLPSATLTHTGHQPAPAGDPTSREVVVDSTAYFIRDDNSGREALICGDVEPDSLSLSPRNVQVWTEAAPKIASGKLRAILIECSYDDSQADNVLFGHLAPRHLVHELQVLARLVRARRTEDRERRDNRKRKRAVIAGGGEPMTDMSAPPTEDESNTPAGLAKRRGHKPLWPPRLRDSAPHDDKISPLDVTPPTHHHSHHHHGMGHGTGVSADRDFAAAHASSAAAGPLAGVQVIIIHVKDTHRDGPLVGDIILGQLKDHERHLKDSDGVGLGCEFLCSKVGESYWV